MLLPLGIHVEQVHEEIIGQRLGTVGEDANIGLTDGCIEYPHAADENRHLRCSQRQQVRSIQQQFFRRSVLPFCAVVAKPVCGRFERGKRIDVGLLLRSIRTAWREGNLHVVPGFLRGGLNRSATTQYDHVRERDLLTA